MKLRALALCLPLLAGCTVTRPTAPPARSALLPPLPPLPGNEPRPSESVPPRALVLQWDVGTACRDVLETSADLAEWTDLPGPYTVIQTGETPVYRVGLDTRAPLGYFRIRREWGNPWVNTPKIESKTKTEN